MVQETRFRKASCGIFFNYFLLKNLHFNPPPPPPPSFPRSCRFSARIDSCFYKVLTMYGGSCVGQGICRDRSLRTGLFLRHLAAADFPSFTTCLAPQRTDRSSLSEGVSLYSAALETLSF
jgi:hypothetical protein